MEHTDKKEKKNVTADEIKRVEEIITENSNETQGEQQSLPESEPGTNTSGSAAPSSTASRDTLPADLANLAEILKSINDIRETLISLSLSEADKVYFDRSVRPILDYINIMAFSATNIVNTARIFESSFIGRKKQIEQAFDLSYDMNKEIECLFEVLKERTAKYLSRENEEL